MNLMLLLLLLTLQCASACLLEVVL
jgi:hypothetical protein